MRAEGEVARRCTGGLICEAQVVERLRHFTSRNAFDIEGLGWERVEAFHKDGLIKVPGDIFRLKRHAKALEEREGWGKKSVERLMDAIEARRTIPLDRFIYALGIRQVGEATAKLLARHYRTLEHWREAMLAASRDPEGEAAQELDTISQIGPSVAADIAAFFAEKHNRDALGDLAKELTRRGFRRADAYRQFARRRQNRGFHRHAGDDDAPGGEGARRVARRERHRVGLEEDRLRHRRRGRGLESRPRRKRLELPC